ncbi:glycosyltransferase family 4 protein [Microbacterium trichothecenolyticum]|uniref:Glycosyltransferase involved in cell wall biosynthesis n=1 Tax=Microbacterium trichothecenolyticum TaxID=69370 RepID=A0ABU0TVY5_MICTR|nr:glycosyltransferase family 1 protein [Microbacterium trichothecenolyticum]MDQ1123675.1 glycosyltransferase involved in cell wall biosynthesis [Microbacterium trichothecenolyticum]
MTPPPAHIVIDARSMFTSTGRYTRKLIENLESIDTDHRYTVVLPRTQLAAWEPTNPRFSKVGTDTPYFSIREQTGFSRELRRLRPDLVHFAMPQQPLYVGAPRVTTFHDMTLLKIRNHKKHRVVSLLKRLIGAGAFAVFAHRSRANLVVSRYSGRDLISYTRAVPGRVTVTYPAADPITDAARPVPVPFPRFVLYVGTQVPYKNLRRLIDAVLRLRADGDTVGLVVAGRIDADGAQLVESLDARTRASVHFTGFVSDGQLRWLYENAAVYAFPSLYEGFGLPGLEAMRHGCPVVSSDATCLPEVYGDAAEYFDPRRVPAIQAALSRVLTDDDLADRLRERGRRRAEMYSWRWMALRTLDAYRNALQP